MIKPPKIERAKARTEENTHGEDRKKATRLQSEQRRDSAFVADGTKGGGDEMSAKIDSATMKCPCCDWKDGGK